MWVWPGSTEANLFGRVSHLDVELVRTFSLAWAATQKRQGLELGGYMAH